MSEYQVIARKWRPQCFSDVVGQQHVVRTLRNAIVRNRTAHAYLFVGPRGVGKTTLARIFAKALNCTNPDEGEPCCKCDSCLGIATERSLDVLEVDAASRNSTGDMRELAEDVLTQPSGRYKIYIIDEVHMLSKQAWNVLLKTVEEPPDYVKFIFATTEVHQVLPTIISRCQRFDLLPIPTHLIAERLQLIASTERVDIDQDAVAAIARAAEGGMRDAQSLLDQMIAFFAQGDGSRITGEQVLSLFGLTDRGDLDALLGAMFENQPGTVVEIISKLSKRGKNLETLFDDILAAVRGIRLCAIISDPGSLLNESFERLDEYRKLGQSVSHDTIQILLENLAPVGRVLHDALNKQVYLETILLKAMREAHAVRIDDILARLNQLRSAGELKFLDQLPPATPMNKAGICSSVQPKKIENICVATTDKIEEIVVSTHVAEEKVAVETKPVATSETVVETKPVATSETAVETKPVATSETAVELKATVVKNSAVQVSNPSPVAEISSLLFPDNSNSHERVSIANSHPEALREAEANPLVADVLELFSGQVIDVHR